MVERWFACSEAIAVEAGDDRRLNHDQGQLFFYSFFYEVRQNPTKCYPSLAAMGGSWRSRSCELADTCAGDRDAQSHCRCGKGR
jgi:hypothetical protein